MTSVTGAVMPWNMMTIGWLEVGEFDKAHELFKKNLQYIQNDFQASTVLNASIALCL